jgi:hypothetical protein
LSGQDVRGGVYPEHWEAPSSPPRNGCVAIVEWSHGHALRGDCDHRSNWVLHHSGFVTVHIG